MAETIQSVGTYEEILQCSNSRFLMYLKERNYHVARYFYPLLQNEDEPVIVFNLSRKLLFINSALRNFYGQTADNLNDLCLEDVIDIIHGPEKDDFSLSWEEMITAGLFLGQRFYRIISLHNKKKVPVLITGTPLFNGNGHRVGGVIMLKVLKNNKERGS